MTVAPPVVLPNPITTALTDLTTCLCAQILTDGLPPVCACSQMPGDNVALDYAGDCDDACGMAWVRLATSYPSTIIGQPAENPGNCSAAIGFEVEIGIIRCLSVGDGDTPPDLADLTAAAVLQQADLLAMWRAVACCRNSRDWLIGSYVPYGPTGGLVGGTLPVAIQVT